MAKCEIKKQEVLSINSLFLLTNKVEYGDYDKEFDKSI